MTEVGTAVGHVLAGFFIILFSTYFFLADGDRIWAWMVRLAPRAAREHVDSSGRVAWISLTQFVRATVIVAAVDAIGIMIVAAILGVPFVLAIGVLVFLGAFVPMVGATIAGTVAILVALVDQGPITALLMLGGVILVQQIEGHILQPFLMGRWVSVHPLGVIVAIGCGVLVAGIAGALVAVPLAAAVNAVVQHLASRHRGRRRRSRRRARRGHRRSRCRRSTRSRARKDHCVTEVPTVSLADIEAARELIDGHRRSTRRWRSRAGCRPWSGGPVHLKCENLQRTGSFKIRGAYVRISRLSEDERAARRRRRLGRQPRAGRGPRRHAARHQVDRLHARGRADPQGEGDPRVRRRRGLPRPLPRGRAGPGPRVRGARPGRC